MAYKEGQQRVPLTVGLTQALSKAIKDSAPTYPNSDGEWVPVPVNYVYDEISFTEYSTPSITIFNPNVSKLRELITNEEAYRDFDYDKLTAKAYPEPIPVRVAFKVHCSTRNPDNDLMLLEYISKFYTNLSYVDCPLIESLGQYDRYQVVWFEPTEFESTDVSKIREITCEIHAWLEPLNYREVRLLEPGNAVELVHEDFKDSIYHLKTRTTLEVYRGDTEILVTEELSDFPIEGTAQIGDDIFTYTSRKVDRFLGVSGITIFHNFDTEIVYVNS